MLNINYPMLLLKVMKLIDSEWRDLAYITVIQSCFLSLKLVLGLWYQIDTTQAE